MSSIGYENLERAIENNELKLYLESNPKYSIKNKEGFDVMNDFYEVAVSINEYGSNYPEFIGVLKNNLLEILNENKIFYTYSIANIIKEHLYLESIMKNKINFVDENLLMKLRESILLNKDRLNNMYDYDGSLYSNGLMGQYEKMDKDIYGSVGRHIL